jgi:uncharacterized protein
MLHMTTTVFSERLARAGPKRVLSLDGGGIRGLISLGYLRAIETLLRIRYGNPDLVLATYFDFVIGTSTGAVIATLIALGYPVSRIQQMYLELAVKAFHPSNHWGLGAIGRMVGNRFDTASLEAVFRSQLGDLRLGAKEFQAGLGIVTMRLDTGSIWPLVNVPASKYYAGRSHADGSWFPGNSDLLLWKVLRASTAAPTYFQAELIEEISTGRTAEFIDGGVSAHNNPALLALILVATEGFGLNWPVSDRELLLCSVGTGRVRVAAKQRTADKFNVVDWASVLVPHLVGDSMELVETVLQWMSNSPTAGTIDRVLGQVRPKLLNGRLLHYLRYNVELDREKIDALGVALSEQELRNLQDMSSTESIAHYSEVGDRSAGQVQVAHFPPHFDPEPQRVKP